MVRFRVLVPAGLIGCIVCAVADAATMTFFSPDQVAALVSQAATSDTIRSQGYLFTYSRDKLFTGGTGQPIGRPVRIAWPTGVEAQAVTAGPHPGKAQIAIERTDGDVFDFTAFTARLLANTAGAGGSFEVVPYLNGQEVLQDPVVFDASGYYWSTFHYDTSPNPWGSTALLTGYDKYTIDLYVDFALIGLTFTGAPVPTPPGDYTENFVVDAADYVTWRSIDDTPDGYAAWRENFGSVAGSGPAMTALAPAAVPEPVSLAMLAAGFVAALFFRKTMSRIDRR
jgi:hypothetical protein